MNILLAFSAALLTTLIGGGIAYFLAKHFASKKAARLAAFWLTVGGAANRHSVRLDEETAIEFSALAGGLVAIFLLWRFLLRPLSDTGSAEQD
jgi:hypothetical protein